MKYIDDDEYGVMYLEKINGTDWYLEVGEASPDYVKLGRNNGKDIILEVKNYYDTPEQVSYLMAVSANGKEWAKQFHQ